MTNIKPILTTLLTTALFFLGVQWTAAQEVAQVAQEVAYYEEPHRPQYHFSPENAWMNDPNGMVYYDGEYHLFYQHYPYATVWGPMHWGHAISKDLVEWEHLPIALYPDEHGLIFSGSAVVDWNNTSGFGDSDTPPMVAIFSYHNMFGERTGRGDYQTQGIAYSLDKGRTWTKYAGNPVLPNPGIRDFRDPKVIWHDESQQWVMILAAKDRLQIYHSPDLKNWTFASELGKGTAPQLGVWECPDIFPLTVEGTDQQKWIVIISHNPGGPNGGSCTRYLIGDFDGKTFTSDYPLEQLNWLDYGKDNYAGVTWSDIPENDGRRIFMGWMSNWQYANNVPTQKWRNAMTIPRKLTLRNTTNGLRLCSTPVKELERLRRNVTKLTASTITDRASILNVDPTVSELELVFDIQNSDSRSYGVELLNAQGEYIRIGLDKVSNLIIIDRSNAGKMNFSNNYSGLHYIPYSISDDQTTTKWRIFFDRSSLELFVDDGAIAATEIFFPTEDFDTINLFAFDGKAVLKEGKIYELKDAW